MIDYTENQHLRAATKALVDELTEAHSGNDALKERLSRYETFCHRHEDCPEKQWIDELREDIRLLRFASAAYATVESWRELAKRRIHELEKILEDQQ